MYLRICSSENTFEKQLLEIKNNFLIPRNYTSKLIEEQFQRVRDLPGFNFKEKRKNALEKKTKTKTQEKDERIIFPVDFNPHLPKISKIFAKHHKSMLFRKPELKTVFPAPPMAALRQPPNLRRLLCKSKFKLEPIQVVRYNNEFVKLKFMIWK